RYLRQTVSPSPGVRPEFDCGFTQPLKRTAPGWLYPFGLSAASAPDRLSPQGTGVHILPAAHTLLRSPAQPRMAPDSGQSDIAGTAANGCDRRCFLTGAPGRSFAVAPASHARQSHW